MLKCPSQSKVKFVVAYVEVEKSIILRSTLVSQLNGSPPLLKDRLTWNKAGILYMKPKLITATNDNNILNLGCDCVVLFTQT